MAHPVRPDSYLAINNFYTPTIYEKGAEVVRMMHTLVGRDGFAAGITLYFKRHDGQAVTCDDFAQAIADANPDSLLAPRLDAFKRWYCAERHAAAGRARRTRRRQRAATRCTWRSAAPPRRWSSRCRWRCSPATGRRCRCSSTARPRRATRSGCWCWTSRSSRGPSTGVAHAAGAVAAARLLRAGGAARRPGRRGAADPAGPRQRPVQPLGSRAAARAAPAARRDASRRRRARGRRRLCAGAAQRAAQPGAGRRRSRNWC